MYSYFDSDGNIEVKIECLNPYSGGKCIPIES